MANDAVIKLKLTRLFFTASLACVLVVALFAGLKGSPGWAEIAGATVALAAASWYALGALSRRGWPIAWALAFGVVNVFVVVPEMALRLVDFHYESGIQFGFPRPTEFVRYEPDEKLFWKLLPGAPETLHVLPRVGANADTVNSWGFAGREPRIPKPKGAYRMLFLGDSCTQQGYPELVETFMNTAHRAERARFYDVVTLAIAGYSSHQGRVIAETYGAEVEPDVVFVYYGWNDHWRAYGTTDADKVVHAAAAPTGVGGLLKKAYANVRVLQGVNKLRSLGHDEAQPLELPRVPPDRYRENLTRIEQVFAQIGVPVVFITAPTAMYQLGVPQNLIEMHFAANADEVTTVHRRYNQIVREVAAQTGAKLLDLEAEMDQLKGLRLLFLADRVHYTTTGLAVIARRIADFADAELLRPDAL